MTPAQLTDAGIALYGQHGWQIRLARELDVDYSTVKRWLAGVSRIPGPAVRAVRLSLRVQELEQRLAAVKRRAPRKV